MNGSGSGYRSEPDDAAAVFAEVDAQSISRNGLSTAFAAALEAVRNTDDEQVDAVIFALSELEGDLRNAPERIDSAIAVALRGARNVMAAIEDGDARMAQQATAAATGAFDARRFGLR